MGISFDIKSLRMDGLALQLKSLDVSTIINELEQYFVHYPQVVGMPFVVDGKHQPDFSVQDAQMLLTFLKQQHVKVVALKMAINDHEQWRTLADEWSLTFLPLQSSNISLDVTSVESEAMVEDAEETLSEEVKDEVEPNQLISENKLIFDARRTLLIDKPVRSGQQIYAKDSDLIVTALVSAGAEVIADGHVHIYAPLRGRAIAGAAGNHEARIFVHSMEAQLVAIAGAYRIFERELPASLYRQTVVISLLQDKLEVKPIL